MRNAIVDYPRIVACSVFALFTLACARWAQADSPPTKPQGRTPEGPAMGNSGVSEEDAAEARIVVLQKELDDMQADLVHLRFALDRINGVEKAQPALTSEAAPEAATSAVSSDLFAPPPVLASAESLFYEAELSTHPSRLAAESNWRNLSARMNFAGLSPRYADVGGASRLSVGPFASSTAAVALCAEMASLSLTCHVAGAASLSH